MKFTDYQLHPQLQKALDELKFEKPTEIQEQTLSLVLTGRDIAGLAQTGTGKTGAFLIPLVDRVLRSIEAFKDSQKEGESWRQEPPPQDETHEPSQADESVEASPEVSDSEDSKEAVDDDPNKRPIFTNWQPRNFVLILVPTRELADQVYTNAVAFTKGTNLRSVSVYGGTSYDKQKSAFADGVEFVVATPGRLIDLYKEHVVDLKQVRAIVFDEADRMFDMGFKDDMKYILRRVPQERQFLVFSATLNFDVLNVAYEVGADPVEINVSKDRATAEHVKDELFHVGHDDKPAYLLSLLRQRKPKQTIIFSNFKRNVERIAVFLNRNQIPAVGISSLLTQAQRNRVMEQFKGASDQNILVATDVAARGLDILGVDLVVNFELPDDAENYVHRIGRTGRAGQEGRAFSLVSDRDVDALARIQDYLNRKIETGWLEDSDIVTDFERFPSERDVDPVRPQRTGGRDGRPSKGGRGGERDRGGSRDRDGRPERKNQRRSNNKNFKKREDVAPDANQQKKAAPSRPAQETNTHRDRKTGRHQARPQVRPQAAEANANAEANGATKPRSKGRKQRPQRRYSRAGGQSKRPQAPPPSLGQKVSGFFKKLFG